MADEMKPGATGRFPRGKLNLHDEGELAIAIGIVKDSIVIDFGKKISWIGMDANQAFAFASKLQDKAAELVAKKQNKKS